MDAAGNDPNGAGAPTPVHEYKDHRDFLRDFFSRYEEGEGMYRFSYLDQLQRVANFEETIVDVDLEHLRRHVAENGVSGEEVAEGVTTNTARYMELMREAMDYAMPEATVDPFSGSDMEVLKKATPLDMLMRSRLLRARENQSTGGDATAEQSLASIPSALKRRYELRIRPDAKAKPLSVRQIRAGSIGRLVSLRAMVTRVTEVKPLVQVATYTCDTCPAEVYQEVNAKTFMPLVDCPTPECRGARLGGNLEMQTRASKFLPYQELKVQEIPEQVPVGHIPRSTTVQVQGSLTGACGPGDIVTILGVFLPTPYTGFRALRAGLVADTFVEAIDVEKDKKTFSEMQLDDEMEEECVGVAGDADAYTKIARSIAPEIYGLEDVKKALLLQLVSGVTRKMGDGMKIRGDINICLMGDPGVAKSQLLKYVTKVAPRAVYTTGKGSSGVGLTAAVMRDPVTNEMTLEGGALVLADMGICCIDEFDKMDDTDRTSIHEVMEQQTVSIAKGGITTTLNARTAVLAAANPLYGRYNLRRSVADNVNLPAALLSRFDLLFLLLDRPSAEQHGGFDRRLARHITLVHMTGEAPPLEQDTEFQPFSEDFIRSYITLARRYEPFVPQELTEEVAEMYVSLRQKDVEEAKRHAEQSMMTARQLLSVLRMAQAHARLRFSDEVSREDVEEAMRLVRACRYELEATNRRETGYLETYLDGDSSKVPREDPRVVAWRLLQSRMKAAEDETVTVEQARAAMRPTGLSASDMARVIQGYIDLEVIMMSEDRNYLTLVDPEVGRDRRQKRRVEEGLPPNLVRSGEWSQGGGDDGESDITDSSDDEAAPKKRGRGAGRRRGKPSRRGTPRGRARAAGGRGRGGGRRK